MFIRSALALTFALPITTLAGFSNGVFVARQNEQTASEEYTSDSAFRDAALEVSNLYRKEHNATELRWNETLAEMAQEWSERCVFEHSVSLDLFHLERVMFRSFP